MAKASVQDDRRQREMLMRFNLELPSKASRSGVDAILRLDDGRAIEFELKSTTAETGSVTTVRDFGPDHILKWKSLHWLFSFYDRTGEELKYTLYGSPAQLAPWIAGKEKYVSLDFMIAKCVPELITLETMYRMLGQKEVYTYEDAFTVYKRQYNAEKYRTEMDMPPPSARHWKQGGYTPARMLTILQARCQYLIRRGSTLNNPHIDGKFFDGWPRITSNHAATLRKLVLDALVSEGSR